jgi:hypothetical protein
MRPEIGTIADHVDCSLNLHSGLHDAFAREGKTNYHRSGIRSQPISWKTAASFDLIDSRYNYHKVRCCQEDR